MTLGSANPSWKGEGAGQAAIHQWIAKHYPRVGRCEYCGRTDRETEYASASHDCYTRNRADWFEFCRSCHRRFDGHGAKITAIQMGVTNAERKACAKPNPKYNGRGHPRGAKNPLWKGDAATDGTIHAQLNIHYPRTGICEHCGSTDRRTEYATKDHSKPYSREREGWLELCKRCHAAYDNNYPPRREGKPHRAETKVKITAAALGRRHSAESKAKIAAARQKQSIGSRSPETKARIAAGVKAAHERRRRAERG